MKRSDLQEKLVALYLRLNGYLTTGLIIHFSKEIGGEIDIIGVRFQGHQQPDREISSSNFLEIPNNTKIDLIIGEVKGKKAALQFNESLRLNPDRVKKMINWIGCIDNDDETINEFQKLIEPLAIENSNSFKKMERNGVSVRPIIFAPDRNAPRPNQIKFVHGAELINYCWSCLRPAKQRIECSTDYKAINNWGEQFENILGYFKNKNKKEPGMMDDLYQHFNIKD